jgi:hypothetical protein
MVEPIAPLHLLSPLSRARIEPGNPFVVWHGLLYAGVWGGALLALSLLIQPQWIAAWLQQVAVYRSLVQPPTLLPVGL